MRACTHCGLSIGETATFCQVCGTLVGGADGAPAPVATSEPEPAPTAANEPAAGPAAASEAATEPAAASGAGARAPADLEAEARRCEHTDAARAAALYRQAIADRLEADDALESGAERQDLLRLFDRLSLVLKRDGRVVEAIEESEAAAYLGLLGNGGSRG